MTKREDLVAIERRGTSVRIALSPPPDGIPDPGLCGALTDALKKAQRDPDIRCVIVEGPSQSFGLGTAGIPQDACAPAALAAAVTLLRTMPLPTCAILDGEASGIGATLVLACDLRFATPASRLILSSVGRGAPLDIGLTWELVHALGRARAFDLLYTGRPVDAAEAVELGLLTRVVPEQELASFVDRLAAELEAFPRDALAAVKRSLVRAEEADFDDALEFDVLLAESQALSAP